jgi:hypothetical protein
MAKAILLSSKLGHTISLKSGDQPITLISLTVLVISIDVAFGDNGIYRILVSELEL